MKKQDFFDLMDPMSMVCVNPYDVNPLTQNTMLPSSRQAADVPYQDDSAAVIAEMLNNGYYQPPKPKIKMEMEEFKDLSLYLTSKPTSTISADELNTPTFDTNKDAFDFNFYADKYTKSEEQPKNDCEEYYDINTYFKSNPFTTSEAMSANENTINYIDNNNIQPLDGEMVCNANPSDSDSPIYDQNSYVDDNALSVKSIDSYGQYTYVAPPGSDPQQYKNMSPTPDGSSDSSLSSEPNSPAHPKLILDINTKHFTGLSALSTPEVLEEVANLETVDFNILDLVKNEDITVLDADKELLCALTENTNESAQETCRAPRKARKRKSATDDEEDEDYVPPTKNKTVLSRRKIFISESESESEDEILTKKRPKPRGRPPKRNESLSSDCSKDSDVSKYRELRDKNNEASRKSRLKRKIREQEFEKEADELHIKNIKLKAQVEELEKMVNNFRNNLFRIMIPK